MQAAEMQRSTDQFRRASFLPTTTGIKQSEFRSGNALLEAVLHDGKQTYKPLCIKPNQLDQVEIVDRRVASVAADAEDIFFFNEANRRRRKSGSGRTILDKSPGNPLLPMLKTKSMTHLHFRYSIHFQMEKEIFQAGCIKTEVHRESQSY